MSRLHEKIVVIDGLIVSDFGRSIFEDMRKGGVTAANCTCCVWENFTETMQNIAKWKTWFRDDHDLITQVFTTDDIARAKREGKSGIILGWQNTSAIEDRIGYLQLFHELGIRIIQMTYNTQNMVGSGCYESHDGGLSDFGRDVVAEMNRLGIFVTCRTLERRRPKTLSSPPSNELHTLTAFPQALRNISETRAMNSYSSLPSMTALSALRCLLHF